MDCIEVRSRLAGKRGAHTPDETMRQHLEQCKACHKHAADMKLARLLSSMPVPTSSPGFHARIDAVIADAVVYQAPAARHRRRLPLALAATVLIAVTVGIMTAIFRPPPTTGGPSDQNLVVRVEPGITRMIDVSVNSPQRLDNAAITLRLGPNIVLSNHPDIRTLHWRTSIAAGESRISLPLTLARPGSGNVTVVVTAHGMQRSFTLALSSRLRPPKTI